MTADAQVNSSMTVRANVRKRRRSVCAMVGGVAFAGCSNVLGSSPSALSTGSTQGSNLAPEASASASVASSHSGASSSTATTATAPLTADIPHPSATSTASSFGPDANVDATSSALDGAVSSPSDGSGAAANDAQTEDDAIASAVERVPVFVAQGHLGRLTVSCDDGRSWVGNHSQDDSAVCWGDSNNQPDCDHNAWAGRGLAYGNEWFVATWGWGEPGTVQRSRDGVTWENVLTETTTFADIAFGAARFVANNGTPRVSGDGAEWTTGDSLQLGINERGIGFVDYDGGRFITAGESGESRAISWSRDGLGWTSATSRNPDTCGGGFMGIASNSEIAILAGNSGLVCFSEDGGQNWDSVDLGVGLSSPPVWTGSEFFVYCNSTVFRSLDGKVWASEEISPPSIQIGILAHGDSGTFVASNAGWKNWYEAQEFYRSVDGVNWDVLDSSKFVGSHPIYFMEFGYVDRGPLCP